MLCLNETEMGILQRILSSMVRVMCELQLNDVKRAMDLMLMLGSIEQMECIGMVMY